MNKDEEDIFEDINDEIVSSDEDTLGQIEEEQPQGVPSNSNKGGFINGFKSASDFQKNNKSTIDRLNDSRNKNQTMPKSSGHIGTDIGNKITGKKEEDKSGAEKLSEDIGGEVAGKGVTIATGGAIKGKTADELGRLGLQLQKDQFFKKFKKYKVAAIISISIILLTILIIVVFSNNDDPSTSSSDTNGYVIGDMDKSELLNYLNYIGVCPSLDTIEKTFSGSENFIQAIIESNEITRSCRNALRYYNYLKQEYDNNLLPCPVMNASTHIDKNKSACEVTLPTLLIMETMSYGLSDQDLFSKKYDDRFVNYGEDIRKLSFASTEYVHESCYIFKTTYYKKDGTESDSACDDCTAKRQKINKDLYYFQISFNKYYSYLKYGDTSTHPNYQGLPFEKGKNYDHECRGQENDDYTSAKSISNS